MKYLNSYVRIAFLLSELLDTKAEFATNSKINLPSNQKDRIEIYPNPFTDGFNIKFHVFEAKEFTITVLDAVGKLVYQQDTKLEPGVRSMLINTAMESGVYFVKIQDKNGPIQFEKLIKQ